MGEGLDVNTTLASAIMTRNPTYVNIDSSAVDALQKMIQGKVAHTVPLSCTADSKISA